MALKNLPYGSAKKNGGAPGKMIKDFSTEELEKLQATKEKLEEYFNGDGQEIFEVIKKITGKPIYTKEFHASFATAGLYPYDVMNDLFMVPATKNFSKQLTVICHELLHLQVSHYYQVYCLKNGLTKEQFSNLNEALTFLLNDPLFQKFSLLPDKGYPYQRGKRQALEKAWQKTRDFSNLIEAAIKRVKE